MMERTMATRAAIADIRALKARYFRCVDEKDWRTLATLFTSDATMFFPEHQTAPVSAREAIAFIATALTGGVSIHHGHMPEIALTSSTTATGIWGMEDRIHWTFSLSGGLGLEWLHGYGHYHEQYRLVAGAWRISTLKLTRLWSRTMKPARQT